MENSNPTVLITGGAQGIGRCTAQFFLQRDYHVVIADIDEEAGQEAHHDLQQYGSVHFVYADVTDEPSVRSMVDSAVDFAGGLSVLINNAAHSHPYNGPVEDLSLDHWNKVLQANLTGYFLCAKHAIPHLREQGGSIVNICSTRALTSEPESEAYTASKGGVLSLTHALANSLSPDVMVNAISPGWIDVTQWQKTSKRTVSGLSNEDHEQHLSGRVGKPGDIAKLAYFLAQPDNDFITGANYIIDGGMTKKMIYV